jgi:hypothetical protein
MEQQHCTKQRNCDLLKTYGSPRSLMTIAAIVFLARINLARGICQAKHFSCQPLSLFGRAVCIAPNVQSMSDLLAFFSISIPSMHKLILLTPIKNTQGKLSRLNLRSANRAPIKVHNQTYVNAKSYRIRLSMPCRVSVPNGNLLKKWKFRQPCYCPRLRDMLFPGSRISATV